MFNSNLFNSSTLNTNFSYQAPLSMNSTSNFLKTSNLSGLSSSASLSNFRTPTITSSLFSSSGFSVGCPTCNSGSKFSSYSYGSNRFF